MFRSWAAGRAGIVADHRVCGYGLGLGKKARSPKKSMKKSGAGPDPWPCEFEHDRQIHQAKGTAVGRGVGAADEDYSISGDANIGIGLLANPDTGMCVRSPRPTMSSWPTEPTP